MLRDRPGIPDAIARQLLRSGTSVGANLEEARASQTRRDATAKFSIALKEARESAYWLRLLQATALVKPPLVADLQDEADQLIAVLTVSRRRLNDA